MGFLRLDYLIIVIHKRMILLLPIKDLLNFRHYPLIIIITQVPILQ